MLHHYPAPTHVITASTQSEIEDQVKNNVVFGANGAPHLNFAALIALITKFGPAILTIIQAILSGLTPPAPTPTP